MIRYDILYHDGWWEVRSKNRTEWELIDLFRSYAQARNYRDGLMNVDKGPLVSHQAAENLALSGRERVIISPRTHDQPYVMITWRSEDWVSPHVEWVTEDALIDFLELDLLPNPHISNIRVSLPRRHHEV